MRLESDPELTGHNEPGIPEVLPPNEMLELFGKLNIAG
jgi:hypothetical protein